jgi:hypothetical protein
MTISNSDIKVESIVCALNVCECKKKIAFVKKVFGLK